MAATSSDLPIDHQRCRHGPLSHREEDLETHVQNNTVLNQDFSSHGDSDTLKPAMMY